MFPVALLHCCTGLSNIFISGQPVNKLCILDLDGQIGKAKRLGVFGTKNCDTVPLYVTVPKIVNATADITKLRTFPSLLESIADRRLSKESLQLTNQDSSGASISGQGPRIKMSNHIQSS